MNDEKDSFTIGFKNGIVVLVTIAVIDGLFDMIEYCTQTNLCTSALALAVIFYMFTLLLDYETEICAMINSFLWKLQFGVTSLVKWVSSSISDFISPKCDHTNAVADVIVADAEADLREEKCCPDTHSKIG